jgi:alpha-ketoglutaric semialdehyde dehydrogenase
MKTMNENIIGYHSSALGNSSFKTINPKTNQENETELTEATREEVNLACALAASAFKKYRRVSGKDRATFLHTIAEEILNIGDPLLELYMSESALPKGRAEGERSRMIGQLKSFAALIEKEDWREISFESVENKIRKLLIPIGPIAVFGASNFPFAFSTAGGDTASALAAGNPVVAKNHPMHAGTGAMIAKAIQTAAKKTGMPDGVFSNLNSNSHEVGKNVVQNKHIKAVGFTGSLKGGRALFDIANQRDEPIPVFAEMGSINPVVITQNALKERSNEIASMYADSITTGVGQFCTSPGLLLTIKSAASEAFVSELSKQLQHKNEGCMLHPSIYEGFINNRNTILAQDEVNAVLQLKEGEMANSANAALVEVPGAIFLKNTKLHQEVFGPFSMVVSCDNEEQLLEIIQNLEGQLTATIMAEESDVHTLDTLVDALQDRVGRLVYNGVPTGVEVCEAMTHGGPYPASTDSRFTAVGTNAIRRWVRPFTFQNLPESLLPNSLKNA